MINANRNLTIKTHIFLCSFVARQNPRGIGLTIFVICLDLFVEIAI
jgi:hypothetical protein